jgi:hypothetical protein
MNLWQHKKRSCPKRWHQRAIRGDTSQGKACATSFVMIEHIQQRLTETPIHSGEIRWTDNEMRDRWRTKLMWDESVKRDLKDWSITKELALDKRKWKLAIHVLKSWFSVSSPLLLFCQSFFINPFFLFFS